MCRNKDKNFLNMYYLRMCVMHSKGQNLGSRIYYKVIWIYVRMKIKNLIKDNYK